MPIATNLVATIKNGNKTKTQNIPYANPDATDENLATFAAAFFGLSQNSLVNVSRVDKHELSVSGGNSRDPQLSLNPTSLTIHQKDMKNFSNPTTYTIEISTVSDGEITAEITQGDWITTEDGEIDEPYGIFSLSGKTITIEGGEEYEDPDSETQTMAHVLTVTVAETANYDSATATVNINFILDC